MMKNLAQRPSCSSQEIHCEYLDSFSEGENYRQYIFVVTGCWREYLTQGAEIIGGR
jgi:hypothetical protein